jgi:RIO kinase 1
LLTGEVLWCRYVQGDFRFRTGYCKTNPRKMVKLWAEKEFRNLSRLKAAGIRCPQPVHLRMHVLVMEFVGSDGVAAPRLKVSLFRPPAAAYCYCLTL